MSNFVPELVVISGCMFAGKTGELVRQLNREIRKKYVVQIFKPCIDGRYSQDEIVSHDGHRLPAQPVSNAAALFGSIFPETQVVGIDEVQFFDKQIVEVCTSLVKCGKRVIVAGLPLDFRGEDFGQMPRLLARADIITKVDAICTLCDNNANRTQRLINGMPAKYSDPVILIGAEDSYEARCQVHHEVPR